MTLVSFHITPSAETILVITNNLKLAATLYGFDVREVFPGKVVFIEDMIHFAPVSPERLELADLHTGARTELYPPRGDTLRAAFAREHAIHMPPSAICTRMNDPCKADLYDEDIQFVENHGRGDFTFTVDRVAAHATEEGKPPQIVASEVALYRYAWNGESWLYCEEKQPATTTQSSTQEHCTPNLPVTPDLSTADFSPFDKHFAR